MGNPQRLLQSVFTRSALPSQLQQPQAIAVARDKAAQVDYGKTERFNSLPYTQILFANQWSGTSVFFLSNEALLVYYLGLRRAIKINEMFINNFKTPVSKLAIYV